MGANAQTIVPTFTTSQVLTADQMNQSARTGVPVFASTVTRDAGFGGTGEKTLAEGQLCYVEGVGLQSYNGTSWVTWGAAPSDPGLVFITSQTIGNAVSSVTVSNVFSSTYDNYKIMLSGGVASTTFEFQLSLGSTNTGYYASRYYGEWGQSSGTYGVTNGTRSGAVGSGTTNTLHANIEIMGPNLAKRTTWNAFIANALTSNNPENNSFAGGFLNDNTQYTSFTLTPNTGNMTGGIIRVYGYRNS